MEVKILVDVLEADEPVTLALIKSFCRIDSDYTSDDAVLMLIAKGARERLEKELNLSFAKKTIRLFYSGKTMDIPYGPVRSIDSLTTGADTATQVEYNLYGLEFPRIRINDVHDFYIIYPVGYMQNERGYLLDYEAGYDVLPSDLKQGLLMQIDYEFKNQGMPDLDISEAALNKCRMYSRNLYIQ